MEWTKEKPNKPGRYLFCSGGRRDTDSYYSEFEMVDLGEEHGHLFHRTIVNLEYHGEKYSEVRYWPVRGAAWDGEWLGPIYE